ncbi:dimethylamine monooxygenase subunit DmmA family protein [Pseudomonas sp. Q1-7]|uniref:dimethylamine monooxygenase subunit DmmA family protein n=1 Tax=Pseudomonas sp. Q1-7 TaxID=3020843 RepID=UPI002300A287|nr:dimethylamine monooxygenase subunit DmmA family protein [Pseudomonas sp. Q1-7]
MSPTATDHPFSVPRYPSGQPNPTADAHLLVTQGAGRDDCAALTAQLGKGRMMHLALPDFPSFAALQLALNEQLKNACVGLCLDLRGDEAFIWPLHALARAAGLQVDEILMSSSPNGIRRVFCVHCSTCQPASNDAHLTCTTCGVVLEVRRHFSQRLGAYLGVCADADQPYQEMHS